jgi:hypothetical protein
MKTKSLKKYITLNDGIDFRHIAKVMTDNGHQMNHATARNRFLAAMRNLLRRTAQLLGNEITDKQIDQMLKSQEIYECLSDLLYQACKEEQNHG